jgi:hypothetical protein
LVQIEICNRRGIRKNSFNFWTNNIESGFWIVPRSRINRRRFADPFRASGARLERARDRAAFEPRDRGSKTARARLAQVPTPART